MRRIAAVLVLAAVLAGCGTSQQEKDYVRGFDAAAQDLPKRFGVARNLPADADAAAQARRVAAIQGMVLELAARLERLTPPSEARDAHRRYIAGLRGFARDLEPTEQTLRRGDVRGAQRALESGRALSRRTREDFDAARQRFERLGYDLNGLDIPPAG